jgi:hypothetical protein
MAIIACFARKNLKLNFEILSNTVILVKQALISLQKMASFGGFK